MSKYIIISFIKLKHNKNLSHKNHNTAFHNFYLHFDKIDKPYETTIASHRYL